MNRNFLLATSMVAGLAGFAASASAQGLTGPNQFTVYGGGSSLAVNLYSRTAGAIATSKNVGTVTTVTDTAFPSGVTIPQGVNTPGAAAGTISLYQGELFYNADGSGKGQKAFLTQLPSVHGITDITPVHFGASDAYLDQSQIDCWNGGSTCGTAGTYSTGYTAASPAPLSKGGPLIQLPAFATAIAIAETNQYVKGIKLDDNDLCGIFSGKITDWSGTEGLPGGTAKAAQAGAISVIYRQDGSGTSFLFTQHLAKVCNSSNTAAGVSFVATKYFADVFGTPSVSGSNHTIGAGMGSNFVPATGSGGVADQLIVAANQVAYLTPDFTNIAKDSLPQFAKVAKVLGTSITSTTVDPLQSPYQHINYASVYNSHELKYYKPNPGSATKALANPNATDYVPGFPSSKTNATNPLMWIPAIADPLMGYPIVGYTTLELATCYSNVQVQNYVKSFLTQLYYAGNKPNLILEGFSGVPAGYKTIIMDVFVKGTSTYAVNIGNPTVCNSTGQAGTYAGL